MKLSDKRQIRNLSLLFTITYMVSYMTRINFGAIISEMETATQISRTLLSTAITGGFIAYGIGQIISGLCGDKFSPKKLVLYGLVVTVLMNVLIPICKSSTQMTIVWFINGFAQSFMWPPLVKLMSSLLTGEDYKKVTVRVSCGSSIGTILIYFISPLIISLFGWKYVFLFSAACGIVVCYYWNKYTFEVKGTNETKLIKNKKADGILSLPLIGVAIAIVLQGMLRDGVTTWMPTYISQTYNLSNIVSILTGVILPIFSILCFKIASELNKKIFTNPLLCGGIFFFAGIVASGLLLMVSGRSAIISVMLSAILTGCMHGVNLMLVCMIPNLFKKKGNVSTVSGILNSCTYIGSAISTYGIAILSENVGWNITLLIWSMVCVLGTVICLINIKPFERIQCHENNKV